MSLTIEQANKYFDKKAVVCCRMDKGATIGAADLEDPTLFSELEETGIITIPENALTIGEVLGSKAIDVIDGLTAITADLIDEVQKVEEKEPKQAEKAKGGTEKMNKVQVAGGTFVLEGESLNNFKLELPLGVAGGIVDGRNIPVEIKKEVLSTLEKRTFHISKVILGNETKIEGETLTINKEIAQIAQDSENLVKKLEIDIINPNERSIYTDSIMDVIPIATKVNGEIGHGVTNILDGVVFMLTGVDEKGIQIHEFGSSEGELDEKIAFGMPGSPDEGDIIVRVHIVVQENTGMERRGPYTAHKATDIIIQDIRGQLKKLESSKAKSVETLEETRRRGCPKVILVKEIMGQGAMHDNVMLPTEPAGVYGGRQNVDLGNIPIAMSVNEVRDGGIHALACIGPATKEVTRHYFREPLVEGLAADEELDFAGVIFIGSPQVNDEKVYVSKRLGEIIKAMDVDGVIVTTEGFGNNHIDFSLNIQEIGKLGVPVVGVSFCAYQGQLVVGNEYMDAMIELNKDNQGFESEILAENTLNKADADRAIQILKNKIAGVEILPPYDKWEDKVIKENQDLLG
ncbi:MAG: D-proline reductase (dithiol) proprotein PrdA [Senegalia sp. (in: firmicutes)]